jgi:hypothetical protein
MRENVSVDLAFRRKLSIALFRSQDLFIFADGWFL